MIVGAGPGGLASAMLLAHRGFHVEVFEKNPGPGGRTAELKLGDFSFDIGPTFFMMKHVFDEIFQESGHESEEYLSFQKLAPMYRLILPDGEVIDSFDDKEKMRAELARVFGPDSVGIDKFYTYEKKRYDHLMPILKHHNNNIFDVFRFRFLSSLKFFAIGKSLFEEMGRYFTKDLARLSFTFQSKYLGMSPWECPGAFGLVPYIEHSEGVYHVQGGLSKITKKMAEVAEKEGALFHYAQAVKRIIVKNGKAIGVETEDGVPRYADEVIVNADFGYAMEHLFEPGVLKKYNPKKLAKKKISCSIFMMYLGVNAQYRLEHNTIVFAKKYKENVADVFAGKLSGENISFYVRDTSRTDPKNAPVGKSALYVLVPVPNLRADINWKEKKSEMREIVLRALEERLGLTDIRNQIETEYITTPEEWGRDYHVYKGAVFNLAHNLGQMLWFRPHNRFEEVKHCYLVGGGTHPGSGLPTIFESGRIAANLITKKYKK